jgi:hypothetical protein
MGRVKRSDRVLHSHGYLPWQITPSEVGLKPITLPAISTANVPSRKVSDCGLSCFQDVVESREIPKLEIGDYLTQETVRHGPV